MPCKTKMLITPYYTLVYVNGKWNKGPTEKNKEEEEEECHNNQLMASFL